MNFWKRFKSGLFTRSQFLVGVTLTMLATSVVVYAVQVLVGMKVFNSGTTISSADVNSNFSLINKYVEDTGQKFSLGLTTSQSFPTVSGTGYTSLTAVDFETVYYDYTAGTLGRQLSNVGSFTVTSSGLYQITMSGKISTPSTAYGYMYIYKDSTSIGNTYLDPYNIYSTILTTYIPAGAVIRVRAKNSHWAGGSITLNPTYTKLIFQKL